MTDEIRKSFFESNPSGKQGEGHLEKNMIKKHSNIETDILDRKNIDQLQRHCATAAVHGRRGATATSANFGFPAVGNGVGALVRPSLTPPPTDKMGSASVCGNPWSLYATTRRLDEKI